MITVISCVDSSNGLEFFGKRQTKDKTLIKKITEQFEKIYIYSYSEKLFSEYRDKVAVISNNKEVQNGVIFIERIQDGFPDIENVNKIILYRWDKTYPKNNEYPLDLSGYHLVSINEIQGDANIHDKISEEIYEKN